MNKYFVFVIIICFQADVFGQRSSRYDYQKELIWGVNKNTTGGLINGFILRGARKLSENSFESIGMEITNIKHPKEYRWHSARTGSFFIYGKTNYLYSIRAQYGREYILFNKATDQGVEIKLNLAAGPSFGFLTPYYVEICTDCSSVAAPSQNVPYESDIPFSNIIGPGRFLMGLGEASIKMGMNLKASLSYEMGVLRTQVTGFEVGALLDAYGGKNIEMVSNTETKSVFPTAFITLFYGIRK